MARRSFWRAKWQLLLFTVFLFTVLGQPQSETLASQSASAHVRLTAFKRSAISVSVRWVPLAFDFKPTASASSVAVPITTTWNVNPLEVQGVEVVAYFAEPDRALATVDSAFIPARYILGSVEGNLYRPFHESNIIGPPEGSLRILAEGILSGNARATRDQILNIRLDTAGLQDRPSGLYSGILQIEARYY